MSCPNFSLRHNSKKIYAFNLISDWKKYLQSCKEQGVETYDEDDEGAFCGWCCFQNDYYEERIMEELQAKFGKNAVYVPTDRRTDREDASILATVQTSFRFAGDYYTATVDVIAQNGHYEGWTVDFECEEVPDLDDLRWDLHYTQNEGLAKALAPKLQKRLQRTYDELTEQVEEVLESIAPHKLECSALFSNGEAWYRETA